MWRAHASLLVAAALAGCSYPALPRLTGDDAGGSDVSDGGDQPPVDAVVDAGPDAAPLIELTFGDVATLGRVSSVRVVDLDRDGHLDLVAASREADVVAVYYGDGSGTFGPPTTYPTPPKPASVAIADLDQDSVLDLVVAIGGTPVDMDGTITLVGSSISVLRGAGGRSFAGHVDYPIEPVRGPWWITTGDLDDDGHVDAVVSCYFHQFTMFATNTVAVLFGTGTGGFDLASQRTIDGTTDGITGVAVADFDADGVDDVAVVYSGFHWGRTGVTTIFGDRQRQLSRTMHTESGYVSMGLTLGDLNLDGRPDVVTAERYTSSFTVYLDGPDGTLTPHIREIGAAAGHPAVADFNRDGFPDVFVNGQIYLGDGTGITFAAPVAVPINVGWAGVTGPLSAAADLDEDGRLDLVGIENENLRIALSTGQ